MNVPSLQEDEPHSRFVRFFVGALSALTAARTDAADRAAAFLDGLRHELTSARDEIRTHERRHADRFNVFDYIQPDENRLSDILADLLNPNGTHGQRETFLQLFLCRCGVTASHPLELATVYRESNTTFLANDRRRLDIRIDLDTFGVGIENKPTTADQENQVRDYLDELNRRHGGNFLLVYLSGSGLPPTTHSVDPTVLEVHKVAGRFQTWSYGADLVAWLKDAEAACEAERVRWFLRDFREYVQRRFK